MAQFLVKTGLPLPRRRLSIWRASAKSARTCLRSSLMLSRPCGEDCAGAVFRSSRVGVVVQPLAVDERQLAGLDGALRPSRRAARR